MDVKEEAELYHHDVEHDRDNRIRTLEDLEFVNGDQWEEYDRQSRLANNRPTHIINRLPQFIRQVVGDVREASPSIKVRPDGSGSDEEVAQMLAGHMRQIMSRSDHKRPFINAVDSAAKCSIGHFRIDAVELHDNPFNQEIVINPIHNPLAVVWDAAAREVTRCDAEHCFVVEAMPTRTFKKEYPKAKDHSFETVDHILRNTWYGVDTTNVAEFFKVMHGKATFAMLQNGHVVNMDRQPRYWQYDEINQGFLNIQGQFMPVIDFKEGKTRKVKWQKMTGMEVLDERELPWGYLPIIPVVGDQNHFTDRVDRYSLIHWAIEPQRLNNYWRSTQSEILGNSAKSPIAVGTSQAGEGLDQIDAAINGNRAYMLYDDSTNPNPPQRIPPPPVQGAIMNEVVLTADDMKSTTGIYDAGLGAQSNETSGVAITRRQQEGDISTNLFGDNLEASMQYAGMVIMDMIPHVYDAERSIRILHEDDSSEQININQIVYENGVPQIYNDLTTGRYDVKATVGASFATRRLEALNMLREVLQGNPQLTGMYFDLLVELSDAPKSDAIVARARKMLPPGLVDGDDKDGQQLDPMQQMQAQIQQMQAEMEMQKGQAEVANSQAEAQKTLAEAEDQRLETELKALIANGKLQVALDFARALNL